MVEVNNYLSPQGALLVGKNGGSAPELLEIPYDGQNMVLSVDKTEPLGLKWVPSGPGGGEVSEGGTGVTSITDHGIVIGQGTDPIATVAPADPVGAVLLSGGASADPTYSDAAYPSSVSQGSIIIATDNDEIGELPKDTNESRYLSNQGVDNEPLWEQIDLATGVEGVLPVENGGSGSPGVVGAVETTDATPTTLITVPLGATPGVYTFDIKIAGFSNVGAGTPLAIGYTIVGAVRTTGAAATFINQAVDVFEEGAMSSCSAQLTVSGNNAIVQVTGVAAYTIDWKANLSYIFSDATS